MSHLVVYSRITAEDIINNLRVYTRSTAIITYTELTIAAVTGELHKYKVSMWNSVMQYTHFNNINKK